MNWVDLVVLAVIALSGLLAFMRGLVREVLGLTAWIIAGVLASSYGVFPYVQPWMRAQFSDPTTADIVAFGGVFVVTLIVLWMLAATLGAAVRGSFLGGLDRTLGLVFGLVRGAGLIAVMYVLVGMAIPTEQWPAPVVHAAALPTVYRGAEWIAAQVPPAYRPIVAAPPTGRPTTSAMLLQSRPSGHAYGVRAGRE
jgi:membrane protein required for colicin V production